MASHEGLETRRLRGALESKLFGADADPVTMDRYEVVGRIGEGAMGVVYRARDPSLDRDIALKVFSRGLGSTDEEIDDATRRLRREARALAKLAHPNVVTVLNVGEENGRAFVAMEFVDGETLEQWSGRNAAGPARNRRLIGLFEQAARGLAAAHNAGVIHRDIKPSNMLIDREGRLRIVDFGLARTGPADAEPVTLSDAPVDQSTLSGSGAVVGTPVYMAPEQFDGKTDERSDQFSLCASFWEATYGCRAFGGATLTALMVAVQTEEPNLPADAPAVPRRLAAVLRRGLAKDPAQRYPSMRALAAALRGSAPRRSFLLGAGLVAAVGAYAATRPPDVAQRCDRLEDELAASWPGRRRDAVRERLEPADAEAFTEVAAELDAYRRRWLQQRHAACVATWRDGSSEAELDGQMRCFRRAEVAFKAVTDAIAADERRSPTIVDAAWAGLNSLPELGACDGDDEQGRAAPDDPERRAALEVLEDELIELEAKRFFGEQDALIPRVEALFDRIEPLEHVPLTQRAADLLANLYKAAELRGYERLERALAQSEAQGYELKAVRAAVTLSELYRAPANDQEAADQHIKRAEALTQRIDDPEDRAEAVSYVATGKAVQLRANNDYEGALAKFKEVLEYTSRTSGRHHHNFAQTLTSIGRIELHLGRYDEARGHLEEALRLREADKTQPGHVAEVTTSLTRLAFETGKPEEAAKWAERTLEISIRTAGPVSLQAIAAHGNIGAAKSMVGDQAGAATAFRTSIELADELLPPENELHVVARLNLAAMLENTPEKAAIIRAAYDRALEYLGPEHSDYARSLAARGRFAAETGDHEAALPDLKEAIAIYERLERPRALITARGLLVITLIELGKAKEAIAPARKAVEDAERIYGGDSPKMAGSLVTWARVQRARGDEKGLAETLARAEPLAMDSRSSAGLLDVIEELRSGP